MGLCGHSIAADVPLVVVAAQSVLYRGHRAYPMIPRLDHRLLYRAGLAAHRLLVLLEHELALGDRFLDALGRALGCVPHRETIHLRVETHKFGDWKAVR